MIDWLTIEVEYPHLPITGGCVAFIDAEGNIEKQVDRFAQLEGSFEAKVAVRTLDYSRPTPETPEVSVLGYGSKLWISGNPSKFLQGHNLFGTDDIRGLTAAFIGRVLQLLGEPECHPAALKMLVVHIKRVDVTMNYQLRSREDCRAWIRAASAVIRGRRQGVTAYNAQTLYIGQGSRRVTLKIYVKGDELDRRPISSAFPEKMHQALTAYADNLLRVELTLKSMELGRIGPDGSGLTKEEIEQGRALSWLHNWDERTAKTLFAGRLAMMNLPEQNELALREVEGLPPRLLGVYEAWKAGHDLRQVYKKATFYRHRSELLPYGIDISSTPKDVKQENVVPLWRYLEAEPADAPDWAIGTPLMFDTTRRAR